MNEIKAGTIIYMVKDTATNTYLGVGTEMGIKSDYPDWDAFVAKFLTKEDAISAMTNWSNATECEIEEYNVTYISGNIMAMEAPPEGFVNSHLYFRLLREALHMSIREVADHLGISLWMATNFENYEDWYSTECELECLFKSYFEEVLDRTPNRRLIENVAKIRLLQYIKEGWFDNQNRDKRGYLRRSK